MSILRIRDDKGNVQEILAIKGDPFTYDDFTPAQLEALKGEPGKDGTMTFADLTEEQKASLKGDKGEDGKDGADGVDGVTPTVSFRYDDATGGLYYEVSSLPGGSGSGGGDNAWKLIGKTTTETEVTDVIIQSDKVMSELLVYYSVPPIAEDTGGNTYAHPLIIDGSGAVTVINANVNIPKPNTKKHRRIWHITPLGTIRQLWEAGTASPPSEVLGITEDANVMICNAYKNGGGLVGFRLRWNVNGVFPVGTYLEVWGR